MRKRGHVIPLRLTDQELAHLNRCAAASGLPREEYLANALTRSKPWEKMGMSRATWYRKGKPEPVPENQQPE